MNPPFKTVKMFGPCLKDSSKIVNRDVPKADVQAYKAAGYQLGEIEVESIADITPEIDDLAAPKKKGKKK